MQGGRMDAEAHVGVWRDAVKCFLLSMAWHLWTTAAVLYVRELAGEHSSSDGGEAHKTPPLSEKLLAVDGCLEKGT